jgi:hypothetical protein
VVDVLNLRGELHALLGAVLLLLSPSALLRNSAVTDAINDERPRGVVASA